MALFQVGTLIRLLDRLRTEGIDATPVKGPVASVLAYGTPTGRRSKDLDVWVRAADFQAALDVLASSGFVLDAAHDSRPALLGRGAAHHAVLWETSSNVQVELHWTLCPAHGGVHLDEAAMWDRRQTVDVGGHRVPTLSLEDTVRYLAVHGSRHHWVRHEWIECFAGVVRRHPDIDWDSVLERSRATGCERMVRVALVLAERYAGLDRPAALERWPITSEDVARADALRRATGVRTTVFSLLTARLLDGWRDRVRYLVATLVVPSAADHAVVALPVRAYALYSVVRPIRLVCKWARRLTRAALA